jgi:hypothetical protein
MGRTWILPYSQSIREGSYRYVSVFEIGPAMLLPDGRKLRFYSHEVRVEERVRRACDARVITEVIAESGREVLSIIFGVYN